MKTKKTDKRKEEENQEAPLKIKINDSTRNEGKEHQQQQKNVSFSLLKNKKAVGLSIVVVCIVGFGFYYWKTYSSKNNNTTLKKNKKRVRWADENEEPEEEREETMEELAERERQNYEFMLQEERMKVANEIEKTLNQMDHLKSAVAENEGQAKKAKTEMNDMFGDEKAGYDSSLSSMESEQSFDTAFMMKGQLDDKRQGMMEHSKELGNRHGELIEVGKQIGQQYEYLQNLYKEKFGTTYIPQRAIQAKAQADEQQHMAYQQQQQMMAQQKQQAQANAPPPGFEHYAQKI